MSDSREHKNLKNQIRVALNQRGDCTIWNNEQGYAAEHRVRYGLGRGGSDLIGLAVVSAASQSTGRFLALEVKTGGAKTSERQDLFIRLVRRYGGYATVVRSVADAHTAVEDCIEGGDGKRFYP